MHRLFYVEELVRQIAFDAYERPLGSASLLALACSCKILEGPVMDVLWQRQKLLDIILRTLPADCWTLTDGVYRLIKIPTTKEWKRFKTYTGRVAELHVGDPPGCQEVSSATISFLVAQSTVDPLWPGLTSLRLYEPRWEMLVSALAFLSRKIKAFTLVLPQDTSILLHPILSIASARCHEVQELVLDTVVEGPHSIDMVGGLISACKDTLRTLEIRSPFETEYLPIIANLPRLKILRLEKAGSFSCDIPSDSFPVLEEFTFSGFQERRIEIFLKLLGTAGLKVAKMYSHVTIDFEKSIAALSRFSASLEDLEITAITSLDLVRVPAFRLPFTNLRNVRLRCLHREVALLGSCTLRLSDKAVVDLGAAMPNLTHLTLGNPICPGLQCTTFLALVGLSKTCRELETLEIKIDFRTMVAPSLSLSETKEVETPVETQGHGCKLRKLVVGASILPAPSEESGWIVAAGLGKIFPSLTEVEGRGNFGRGKWGSVDRNLRMFRQVLRTVGIQGTHSRFDS
ncbi:hypothetical protein BJ322DRAFT_1024796 [Thelephora terrestris]|uniref:F-box domain-containing protein n=1 Tax=Thelephora terrestris TaxID=56493 RepID=A0A9P6H712_9AGAM|nr:hypothetical protein BJ322DRAFT_1024796 [Thelephora terrestris]